MPKKKIVLLILDGWGKGEENISNPFRFVQTKNLDYYRKFFPFCLLNASGYAVGLASDQPGNCENGHLVIGTGIIFYQLNVKINLAIESGEFLQNQKLLDIFRHCRAFNSRLHLAGLLSQNNNLADFNHLLALLKLAKQEKFNDVYLHFFTDGIDSPPKSALDLIEKLENIIQRENLPGKIATLCGRFYALDRTNEYFLRTQRAFLLIIEGKGSFASDPKEILKEKYKQPDFNDSLLEPTIFDRNGYLQDNDALLFFQHEGKSIFQLANSFLNPNFQEFKRPTRKNLYIASLTRYLENIDYPVIFEEQKIITNLSRILAENKLKQIKIIDESRKELLNFYFNGFIAEEHPGEVFKILPPFDSDWENLQKQTREFFDYLKITIKEGAFDFIVASLPTFDLIGHKGDFNLALKGIEEMDKILGDFTNFCLENNYTLILTSDHGNIEKMIEPKSGQKETLHNLSPVYFFLIDKEYQKEKTKEEISFFNKKILGSLVDIAPTILDLMNIKIPKEFSGKSLLRYLL
ncbi:MAG: 2,3-bisphosphoglycerate-independent phosphoglycerate mutase [Candidatus Parcubacteria bacterium]|nr:MAG: 2,3-bisphosphoglycerate-independent phosphoglycerate mutase [Candidatus Parcubacteria bacterium]